MVKSTKYWLASPFLLIFLLIALFPIFYVIWGGLGSALGLINRSVEDNAITRRQLSPHCYLSSGPMQSNLFMEIGIMDKLILENVDSLWASEKNVLAFGSNQWLVLSEVSGTPKFLLASDYPTHLNQRSFLLAPLHVLLEPL